MLKACGIRFAVSHAGIPGTFAHDTERYNGDNYTRKDGVKDALIYLRLTRDRIRRFGAPVSSRDVYGTPAAPRDEGEQQDLLEIMIAFHSHHALMAPGCIKMGTNRFLPTANFRILNAAMFTGLGFFLSIRATQKGLGPNVNTTNPCFLRGVTVAAYNNVLSELGRMDKTYPRWSCDHFA